MSNWLEDKIEESVKKEVGYALIRYEEFIMDSLNMNLPRSCELKRREMVEGITEEVMKIFESIFQLQNK